MPPENWPKGKLEQYKLAFSSCYRHLNQASVMQKTFESSYLWNGWFLMQIRHKLIYSNYPRHTYNLTFWNVQANTLHRFHPSMGRFSKKFLSLLEPNGRKVNEAPCTFVMLRCNQTRRIWSRSQKVVLKSFKEFCDQGKAGWDIHRSVRFHG